jgi:hypothetical protein
MPPLPAHLPVRKAHLPAIALNTSDDRRKNQNVAQNTVD